MTELAASRIPVTVTCRVLKLSRQPYYRWLADPITPSDVVEAYRANALFHTHKDDPEFGHRLLADEARDEGEAMKDRTAWVDRVSERMVVRIREETGPQRPRTTPSPCAATWPAASSTATEDLKADSTGRRNTLIVEVFSVGEDGLGCEDERGS